MATLIIDTWSSRCGACGGNAHPDEDAHIHGGPGSMYTKGSSLSSRNGCGAEFTEVIYEGRVTSAGEPPLVQISRDRIEGDRGPEAA